MEILQAYGISLIHRLQSMTPSLEGIMQFFSFTGSAEFYIIFLPLIYWNVDRRFGARLLIILICIEMLGATLKVLAHQPRPYWFETVQMLTTEPSYGFPSSHAVNSLVIWGYAVYHRGNIRWLGFILPLLFMIGLSRLYLGAHFPHDVIFGWLTGGLLLLIILRYEQVVTHWVYRKKMSELIIVVFSLSVCFIMIAVLIRAALSGMPDPDAWTGFNSKARSPGFSFKLSGMLFGSCTAYLLMKRYASFDESGTWRRLSVRYLLGITGVFIAYAGLDVLFSWIAGDETSAGYFFRFIRYCTMSMWGAFAAPWVFLKTSLAEPFVHHSHHKGV